MADEEVTCMCTVLADAVAVLEDAESSPLNRSEAQRLCNDLKNKPQLCVPCGVELSKRNNKIAVRLFGFQILEYYLTHHWMVASPEEKKDLQPKVFALISHIADSTEEEGDAIRESMARVVVEMIKCEESKYWLSMMEELKAVMFKGPVHGELVMLVLLRLSEDAVSIKGQFPVPLYRVTLDNNKDFILKMMRTLIQCRFEQYERVKFRPQDPTVRACARVILAAVKTMAAYLAWVPFKHSHVEGLCCLLSWRDVRVEASDCLLSAINILAIQPNNTPMLVLLDSVASRYLFHLSRTREVLTNKHYIFLKNMCQIMCVFGNQFCRMISLKASHVKVPVSFRRYLDSLLGFTMHSSHCLSSLTQRTWKALFSVERLSKDPDLLAVIPKYLSASRTKLLKVGFPSKNNSPSCEYSRIDFVTDVKFYKFLRNFRDDQKQVIDVLCTLDQITCFQQASTWLNDLLQPPVDLGSESSPSEDNLQSNGTSSFLEWEAITFFFKVIVTTMFQNIKREVIPLNDCMQLLQLLLNFKTKDPRILACVPINIRTLLPLLHFKNDYLIPVLSKLLEIIKEVNVKSHTCNLVRRDSCMCIIQLCESHAKLLLPSFTFLFNHVKQLVFDEMLHLTQTVKSTLMQAMFVLINTLCTLDQITCFQQASTWLNDLLQPPVDFGSKSSPIGGHLHSDSNNSFLEWEAVTFFFKVTVTTMFQNLKIEAIPVNDCVQLLHLLLNFKTIDPRILACVPVNIRTLLPLLHFKNGYSIPVLTKLLEIIVEVGVKSHTCNLVRRSTCMGIIALCESYAKLLLPNFTLLFNYVKQLLCVEMLHLTQMVKSTLMQAMVALINNFEALEQQKTYLEELMVPVSSLWLSEDMQITLAVPKSFVSYVGCDLKITNTAVESPTDLNRSGIIHCVATILGVLQWTRSPTKQNCRNPCANQVLKLLDNLFVLIRTQHNLYCPGVLSKMGELFSKSLNQPEIKNNSSLELPQALLDAYDPQEYSTTLERMQGFFNVLYSCCFSILGCACSSLNNDFYSLNSLADKIRNSAFVNLEYIPHYKLLCIVRVFLRPLLFNCPPEYYESLASPVMGLFLTSVRLRLCYGWNGIDETNMISAFEKSKLDEIILTKEVLQLIIDFCIDKDKIAITDGPNVINAHHESHEEVCNQWADVSSFASTVCSQDPGISVSSAGSHVTEASAFSLFCEDAEISFSSAGIKNAETLVSAVSRQGTDDILVNAESDVCCVPNDAVTFVCTTESDDDDDDDDYLSIAVGHASILSEKVDTESNFTCYIRSENTDSSIEVSSTCSSANQGPESIVVAEKNVCVLFENIDSSFMSSDNIDSEMAAEVPQKQHSIAKEQAPLTKLGICLMKDEDIRSILLNTSFSALMWKDFCHKAATCLCWPLLQHVMSEPCILDTVIHLFTKVIKASKVHRHDLLVGDTFIYLAYRIYASFRPQYIELNGVMRQIPNINLVSLDRFDEMLLDATIHKPDTSLQQFFKDLIKSDACEPLCGKEHISDNVLKSSSKSMKHQMSAEVPETDRKRIKR